MFKFKLTFVYGDGSEFGKMIIEASSHDMADAFGEAIANAADTNIRLEEVEAI